MADEHQLGSYAEAIPSRKRQVQDIDGASCESRQRLADVTEPDGDQGTMKLSFSVVDFQFGVVMPSQDMDIPSAATVTDLIKLLRERIPRFNALINACRWEVEIFSDRDHQCDPSQLVQSAGASVERPLLVRLRNAEKNTSSIKGPNFVLNALLDNSCIGGVLGDSNAEMLGAALNDEMVRAANALLERTVKISNMFLGFVAGALLLSSIGARDDLLSNSPVNFHFFDSEEFFKLHPEAEEDKIPGVSNTEKSAAGPSAPRKTRAQGSAFAEPTPVASKKRREDKKAGSAHKGEGGQISPGKSKKQAASERKPKPSKEQYAYAWVHPKYCRTIFLERRLLKRYAQILDGMSDDAEAERDFIEFLLAVKIYHAIAHLAIRDENSMAATPEKILQAGDLVEKQLFGGFVGFHFMKGDSKVWTGDQQVIGLHLSHVVDRLGYGRKVQRIYDDYVHEVCEESRKDCPNCSMWFPLGYDQTDRIKSTKRVVVMSRRRDVSSESSSGSYEDSTSESEPVSEDSDSIFIDTGDGCVAVLHACGTRYFRGIQCRELALDNAVEGGKRANDGGKHRSATTAGGVADSDAPSHFSGQ